jgi:hypothetical protein
MEEGNLDLTEGEDMAERYCWRCGKELSPGALTYVVHIRVFADFDGVLLEPEEGADQQLKEILEQIKEADPKELEKEVYEELTLHLCKSCRDRFVEEIQHPWGGLLYSQKGGDRILH